MWIIKNQNLLVLKGGKYMQIFLITVTSLSMLFFGMFLFSYFYQLRKLQLWFGLYFYGDQGTIVWISFFGLKFFTHHGIKSSLSFMDATESPCLQPCYQNSNEEPLFRKIPVPSILLTHPDPIIRKLVKK